MERIQNVCHECGQVKSNPNLDFFRVALKVVEIPVKDVQDLIGAKFGIHPLIGGKIEAIRRLRQVYPSIGLKDAKDIVESTWGYVKVGGRIQIKGHALIDGNAPIRGNTRMEDDTESNRLDILGIG